MAEDIEKNIITGFLEFIKELPSGESIIIILLSLVLFGIYCYFFHKKPLKETVKEKVSEKIEPLKKLINSKDCKIKELEINIEKLKDSNIQLKIEISEIKSQYGAFKDSIWASKGPVKEYKKGE